MRITTNARAAIFAFLTVLLLLAPGREAFGQVLEDLRLFGYFQGRFLYSNEEGVPEGPEQKAGFTLQQLNFMFAKDFGSDFSAFGNIELTNSFSTAHLKIRLSLVTCLLIVFRDHTPSATHFVRRVRRALGPNSDAGLLSYSLTNGLHARRMAPNSSAEVVRSVYRQ